MKIDELKGMMKKVHDLCLRLPECRANDKKLIFAIWWEQLYKQKLNEEDMFSGRTLGATLREFQELPSAETIRRSRQKLQELGFIKPPIGTERARASDEQEIHEEVCLLGKML